MTATAIYARISKDIAGEHLGVDRQERLCRELAGAQGLTVADVLVDNDVSAYRGKRRPAFERLVELLTAGAVSTVVTYHADRLYRRAADLERLVDIVESNGAQVLTVAAGAVDLSTASGRMVARMLGAASQHESERIGERMRAKHDELASKGHAPGGRPPFGYRWGVVGERRTYVVNPPEAEAVRIMARRVLEGASLLSVARELDAAGHSTREGRPWHHSTVRSALLNPAVVALRVHRREIAGPGDWQPILDRATWEEVRAVIADPARKRKRPATKYLLTGLVESTGGSPMTGRPAPAADGTPTRRTYATRNPASAGVAVGADDLEALIVEAVLLRLDQAVLPTPELPASPGAEVAAIEAELVELADLRGKGAISLAEWMAARDPLQRRLETAKAAAATTRRPTASTALLAKPGAVRRAWPTLTFAQRREIIATVIERITVKPATRGRWTRIEERVDVIWRA